MSKSSCYAPPGKIKTIEFTIRPDPEQHERLLAWIALHGKGDSRRRAPAAVEAIERFLDAEGIPRDPDEVRKLLSRYRYEAHAV